MEPLLNSGSSPINQPSVASNAQAGSAWYLIPTPPTDPRQLRPRFRTSPNHPALDITLDSRIASSVDWDIYFISNRREQAQMLIRIFGDEIEAINARKILNQIFRPHELRAMISEQQGQEVRIRQTRNAIKTLKSLLRTVDNNSTTPSKAAEIMAAMSESIATLANYEAELLTRNHHHI